MIAVTPVRAHIVPSLAPEGDFMLTLGSFLMSTLASKASLLSGLLGIPGLPLYIAHPKRIRSLFSNLVPSE